MPILTFVLAFLAASGVFLFYAGLVFPPRVQLTQPAQARGLLSLQARLDAAELPITARELMIVLVIAASISGLLALLLVAPALILAGVTVVPAIFWQRLETQRDQFRLAYDTSLAQCVQLMREGFATTGSLVTAIDQAARNGSEPAAADFREVWRDCNVGTDLKDAFAAVTARRRNPNLRMVADVLTLKGTEGGTAGEVLLGLETMVREQVTLRREIAARQAQVRTETLLVSLAPLTFFLVIKLVPALQAYEHGFYSTWPGQVALTVVVIMSAACFFLSRRIASSGLTVEAKEVAQVQIIEDAEYEVQQWAYS